MILIHSLIICVTFMLFICKFIDFLFSNMETKMRHTYSIGLLFIIGLLTTILSYYIKINIRYGLGMGGLCAIVYSIMNNNINEFGLLVTGILFAGTIFFSL